MTMINLHREEREKICGKEGERERVIGKKKERERQRRKKKKGEEKKRENKKVIKRREKMNYNFFSIFICIILNLERYCSSMSNILKHLM